MAVNLERRRPLPDAFERTQAMDDAEEVGLKGEIVVGDAKERARRVIRSKHESTELPSKLHKLPTIRRGIAKEEVEVERRDRRALQRSRGIADQDRVELGLRQGSGDS
jgi:hypothetical protein